MSEDSIQPFEGYVETTEDALRLVLGAAQRLVPRTHRRLTDRERESLIKSGAVFIFSVDESNIKRWTDGCLWSPSRIQGNFLTYREITGRIGGRQGSHSSASSSIGKIDPSSLAPSLLPTSPRTIKANGLQKKTITVVLQGCHHHVVNYFTDKDVKDGKLKTVSSRPDLMGLKLEPHLFLLTAFRAPPRVAISAEGNPYFASGSAPSSGLPATISKADKNMVLKLEPDDSPAEQLLRHSPDCEEPSDSSNSAQCYAPMPRRAYDVAGDVPNYSMPSTLPNHPNPSPRFDHPSFGSSFRKVRGQSFASNRSFSRSRSQSMPYPVSPTTSRSGSMELKARSIMQHHIRPYDSSCIPVESSVDHYSSAYQLQYSPPGTSDWYAPRSYIIPPFPNPALNYIDSQACSGSQYYVPEVLEQGNSAVYTSNYNYVP